MNIPVNLSQVGNVNYTKKEIQGVSFDDEIIGPNGNKVQYTHWSPELHGERSEPMFLCFDKNGRALPLFIVGMDSMRHYLTKKIIGADSIRNRIK